MLKYILDTSTPEYLANPMKHKIKLEQEKLPATFGFFEEDKSNKERDALKALGLGEEDLGLDENDQGIKDAITDILKDDSSKKVAAPDLSSYAATKKAPVEPKSGDLVDAINASMNNQPTTQTSTQPSATQAAPQQPTPVDNTNDDYNNNYQQPSYNQQAYDNYNQNYYPNQGQQQFDQYGYPTDYQAPRVQKTTRKSSTKKSTSKRKTTKKGGRK
jgi:hypothetical protein